MKDSRPETSPSLFPFKGLKHPLYLSTLSLISFVLISACATVHPHRDYYDVAVRKAIDGDTMLVYYNGRNIKVKLYGVDAPKLDQPWGPQAKAVLRGYENHRILVSEQYQAPDGTPYVKAKVNGKDLGTELLRAGHVWADEEFLYLTFKEDKYDQHQRYAQGLNNGLWGAPNPKAPWLWHQGK